MYVYDALSKVRSDIKKRQRMCQIKQALKFSAIALGATVLGFFVWLGLLIGWIWMWM